MLASEYLNACSLILRCLLFPLFWALLAFFNDDDIESEMLASVFLLLSCLLQLLFLSWALFLNDELLF